MLQAPESSPRSESHIPKVKELREALGFRDQSLLQSKIFNDRLRVFRREYQTGDGVAGTDLHQWKSTEQQAVLSLMVRDFLTANGSIFWPDRADDGHEFMESSRLQYSRDKPIITRILKQLIFRQNLQEFRNLKYKKDQKKVDPTGPLGNTETNPIVIDSASTIDPSLDSPTSFRQPANEAARTEKDPKPIQSPNKKVASPGLGPKRGYSNIAISDTHEKAQSQAKRRKAAERNEEASFFPPGYSRMRAIPGGRSSERTRSKPKRSGYVGWEDVNSITPTPTPGQATDDTTRIPTREKVPANSVETDPWAFPLSPVASNLGRGTATANDSHLGSVSATPETEMQSRLDVPEEMGGRADASANASKETSPVTQIPSPSPAPATQFTITYLVMWREPRIENEIWHPEGGKFLEKTLNQVIMELSKQRLHATTVTSVSFRLSLSDGDDGSQPWWKMQRDDELGFGMMKKRFISQISVWLTEKSVRPLLLGMEIEPQCDVPADKGAIQDSFNITF